MVDTLQVDGCRVDWHDWSEGVQCAFADVHVPRCLLSVDMFVPVYLSNSRQEGVVDNVCGEKMPRPPELLGNQVLDREIIDIDDIVIHLDIERVSVEVLVVPHIPVLRLVVKVDDIVLGIARHELRKIIDIL